MIHPKLYIAEIPGKGRGMFTKSAIAKDTLLEEAPVIILSAAERKHIDKTILHNYIFEWTPDGKEMYCLALGYLSLLNHSYSANCEYNMDYERNVITVTTIRRIKAGEELTINYNGECNNTTEVWFKTSEG